MKVGKPINGINFFKKIKYYTIFIKIYVYFVKKIFTFLKIPMLDISIKTLFVLYLLIDIFIVLFFSAYTLFYKHKYQKLNLYIISRSFQVFTWVGFLLKDFLGNYWGNYLPNFFLVLSIGIETYILSTIYTNLSIYLKRILIGFVFLNIIALFFISASESFLRIFYMSIVLSLFFSILGLKIIFYKKSTNMEKVAGFIAIIITILFLLRAVYAYFFRENLTLFSDNFIQVVTYIAFYLFIYSLPIVYLLLLKERNEKIIVEKTKKIEEDNKILEGVNNTKDKLFSIIGHDLRNPLGAILGFSHLIEESCENKDLERIVEYNKIIWGIYYKPLHICKLFNLFFYQTCIQYRFVF